MKEEYEAAMCCGFPMAVVDLTDVEYLSDCELVELAQEHGVYLRKYTGQPTDYRRNVSLLFL